MQVPTIPANTIYSAVSSSTDLPVSTANTLLMEGKGREVSGYAREYLVEHFFEVSDLDKFILEQYIDLGTLGAKYEAVGNDSERKIQYLDSAIDIYNSSFGVQTDQIDGSHSCSCSIVRTSS
jgi:hypothetical protein